MIVIYTDRDVAESCKDVAFDDLHWSHRDVDLQVPANWSEDVYFWRNGEVKPLKRRNAPLELPEWIKNLEGVDL